jgi:hypothetical protein
MGAVHTAALAAIVLICSLPTRLLDIWNDAIDEVWDLDDPFLADQPSRP